MEGAHYLATQDLVSFSEQQLLDCVNDGQCNCARGGEMQDGFEYIIKNGGILTEDDDSYLGKQTKCKYPLPAYGKLDATDVEDENPQYAATFSSYAEVTTNDEQALLSAVQQQPVSIAIDASAFSFQFYSDGVYDPSSCCTDCTEDELDHGVLLIGYGVEKVKSRFHTKTTYVDYWLVKNSWGASWGKEGMIKMVRNKHSKCGVATDASYPIV
jgi:cathepsin L